MNTHIKAIIVIFVVAMYSIVNADTEEIHGGLINIYNNSGLFASNGSENIQIAQNYKKRKSGQSAKEAAKDIPSWAAGKRPFVGESGSAFAKRLMDEKYPGVNYPTGPGSEYNKIKKYGDRAFE